MTGSLTAAGKAIGDVGRELAGSLTAEMLTAASEAIAVDVDKIATGVAGGDRRLSNAGPQQLGVDFRVGRNTSRIELRPAGLWSLAVGGAAPHLVGTGRRRGGGRQRVVIKGRVVTGPVKHPGTKGKRPAVDLDQSVPETVVDEFTSTLQERFDRIH
jgi:hypothetical protein